MDNLQSNITMITRSIKEEILSRLIGNSFPFKGSTRKISKFRNWYKNGVEMPSSFDLSEIPNKGSQEISVEFFLWVLIELDENTKQQVIINGHFGPVGIAFYNSDYRLEFSEATLSRLTIE
jgi:hypothetical protein